MLRGALVREYMAIRFGLFMGAATQAMRVARARIERSHPCAIVRHGVLAILVVRDADVKRAGVPATGLVGGNIQRATSPPCFRSLAVQLGALV